MITVGVLVLLALVVGAALVVLKILVALCLIPLKIGFGLLKILAFVVIGIPLLVLGAAAAAVAIPFLIIGLPVLFIAGLIAVPFAIAKKL